PDAVVSRIAKRGLEERKGGNPRDRIAREILATPEMQIGDRSRKATAEQIGTTLKVLQTTYNIRLPSSRKSKGGRRIRPLDFRRHRVNTSPNLPAAPSEP